MLEVNGKSIVKQDDMTDAISSLGVGDTLSIIFREEDSRAADLFKNAGVKTKSMWQAGDQCTNRVFYFGKIEMQIIGLRHCLVPALCWAQTGWSAGKEILSIIPWPKTIQVESQTVHPGTGSRIVAQDNELRSLAKILSDEIYTAFGVRIPHVYGEGEAEAGDIILRIDRDAKTEAYRLEVSERAVVSGGNYRAVAWGTATLLQAIRAKGKMISVPYMTVEDEPFAQYW